MPNGRRLYLKSPPVRIDDEILLTLFVYPQLVVSIRQIEFREILTSSESTEQIHESRNRALVDSSKLVQMLEIAADVNLSSRLHHVDSRKSADGCVYWFQNSSLNVPL